MTMEDSEKLETKQDRKRAKLTVEMLEDAINYYLNGHSLQETTRTICSKYNTRFCREALRRVFLRMGIKRNEVKIKVSKDFKITIPLKEIRKIKANSHDYIKVTIEKDTKMAQIYVRIPEKPKSRKNIQVKKSIPLSVRERLNIKEGDIITIRSITKIEKSKEDNTAKGSTLDLIALIPSNIMCECISKNGEGYLRVWCEKGNGRTKLVELKRFVPIDEKLGEFFGLLQAEGSKKNNKLSFTNSIIKEHKTIVEVAETYFGIPRTEWSICLYYNPNLIDEEKAKQEVRDFVEEVGVPNTRIGFVKHYNLTKPNFQIYISSKILASILNNALNFLRKYAVRCKLFEFCKGFVIKVILGDGTVVINKDLTNLTIAISEIDKDAQKDLVSMFKLFSINSRIYRNKVIVSTDFYSCIWFLENNLFEGHEENRMKFLTYIINNHFFSILYKRLETINSIITVEEFAKENNLRTDTARMYLNRNIKRGFIKRTGKGLYEISGTGKKFITLYESALSQYLISVKRGL